MPAITPRRHRAAALAAAVLLLAVCTIAPHSAGAQLVPLPPAGWAGVYRGSCTTAGALRVDADLQPTSEPVCLLDQGRVATVPWVATWQMADHVTGALKYTSSEETVFMVPPGKDAPDLWLYGGVLRSLSVSMTPAPHSPGLGSQCVSFLYEDGTQAVSRSSVYRLGGAVVYQEEGAYTIDPLGPTLTCPSTDLLPLVCNGTIVTFRCVAYKVDEDVDEVAARLLAKARHVSTSGTLTNSNGTVAGSGLPDRSSKRTVAPSRLLLPSAARQRVHKA